MGLRLAWGFGKSSIERGVRGGGADFPFAPFLDGVIEWGEIVDARMEGEVVVGSVIEQLYALQGKDMEILRLRGALGEVPARRERIEARLEAQAAGLRAAEEALAVAGRKVKRLEGEANALRERAEKLRAQQMQIKSNAEYKALEKEIAAVQAGILGKEDEQLEAMEAQDAGMKVVEVRRGDYAKEKERVDADMAEFAVVTAELPGQLAAVEAERAAAAAAIPSAWLARYDRLLQKKHGMVIATVAHGTCGGCHMKLSPAQLVDARKRDMITTCDFCGRILYSPE